MNNYILRRFFNKFQIFFLKEKIKDGLYIKNKNKNKNRKILFYFNDYQIMHFGDILFFEPAIQELIKYGFEVEASLPDNAIKYAKFNNINFFDNVNFDKFDLIITKVEFISFFNKSTNQILFVDTTYNKIIEPLCISLVNRINNFLKITNSRVIGKPSDFIIKNK